MLINQNEEKILSLSETCELLGLTPPTVNKLRKSGKLRGRKLGRKVIFFYSEIIDYLKNQTVDYYDV